MKTSLLLLLSVVIAFFANGQITTPIIKANFGVEGDLRSNYFNNFVQSGNDDWFQLPGSTGTGQFVIDTTGAAELLAGYSSNVALRRLPFYKGMRYPGFTVVNNRLLLDAVFIRDYHGDDSTVFSGGNKNGDNPNDWSCPVSQGVPDKNDILDMMVHVRRAGPNRTDSLWMFGGLSLDNTTGNRYFDFEMYQTDIYYDRGTRKFYGYGPDAGHTSWEFDAAGNITKPGDIIFSAEYQSSSLSLVEARIWVDRAALSITPASFDWSGKFDGSSAGSTYGYASIRPKAAGAYYTGLQCGNGTWAGPFSVVLQDETVATSYIAKQFVEFSVNLTKLGLDPVTLLGSNTCGMPFRRVLVKTRASASFTAELKDFVGPFDFFLAPRVNITTAAPYVCAKTGVSEIKVTNPVATSVYQWTTPNGNIISSTSGTNIYVDQPGTYIVTQYLQSGCSEYAKDTVQVFPMSVCEVLANTRITAFKAIPTEERLQLSWQVKESRYVRFFEIQKSWDGKNFKAIGQVSGQSDILNETVFSYETNQRKSETGFYRIMLVNADNTRSYSQVYRSGSYLTGNDDLSIYPNPVNDELTVELQAEFAAESSIAVHDVAGNLVQQKKMSVQKGINIIKLKRFSSQPGIYLLSVQVGTKFIHQKIMVVK
ncbi:MAG: T9SS type A sorting domain-containing protein [Chitinophagaceae bacterium]|nr:MAG: T9SS type A sorting domain-containing protein [Chitinophagaceae bacterium]